MSQMKGNNSLLDKKRFEPMERERERRLRNMTIKEAIRLKEAMLSSRFVIEWRDNFPEDHPICLKLSLKRMRRASQQRHRRADLKKGMNR